MAKALVLSEETLAAPVQQPRAAQLPKAEQAAKAPKAPKARKAPTVPLQIRIGKDDAKAIKRSALDADQTLSEFMLACYHASMKK